MDPITLSLFFISEKTEISESAQTGDLLLHFIIPFAIVLTLVLCAVLLRKKIFAFVNNFVTDSAAKSFELQNISHKKVLFFIVGAIVTLGICMLIFAANSVLAFASNENPLIPDKNTITATIKLDNTITCDTCELSNDTELPYIAKSTKISLADDLKNDPNLTGTKIKVTGFDTVIFEGKTSDAEFAIEDSAKLGQYDKTTLNFEITNLDAEVARSYDGLKIFDIFITTELTSYNLKWDSTYPSQSSPYITNVLPLTSGAEWLSPEEINGLYKRDKIVVGFDGETYSADIHKLIIQGNHSVNLSDIDYDSSDNVYYVQFEMPASDTFISFEKLTGIEFIDKTIPEVSYVEYLDLLDPNAEWIDFEDVALPINTNLRAEYDSALNSVVLNCYYKDGVAPFGKFYVNVFDPDFIFNTWPQPTYFIDQSYSEKLFKIVYQCDPAAPRYSLTWDSSLINEVQKAGTSIPQATSLVFAGETVSVLVKSDIAEKEYAYRIMNAQTGEEATYNLGTTDEVFTFTMPDYDANIVLDVYAYIRGVDTTSYPPVYSEKYGDTHLMCGSQLVPDYWFPVPDGLLGLPANSILKMEEDNRYLSVEYFGHKLDVEFCAYCTMVIRYDTYFTVYQFASWDNQEQHIIAGQLNDICFSCQEKPYENFHKIKVVQPQGKNYFQSEIVNDPITGMPILDEITDTSLYFGFTEDRLNFKINVNTAVYPELANGFSINMRGDLGQGETFNEYKEASSDYGKFMDSYEFNMPDCDVEIEIIPYVNLNVNLATNGAEKTKVLYLVENEKGSSLLEFPAEGIYVPANAKFIRQEEPYVTALEESRCGDYSLTLLVSNIISATTGNNAYWSDEEFLTVAGQDNIINWRKIGSPRLLDFKDSIQHYDCSYIEFMNIAEGSTDWEYFTSMVVESSFTFKVETRPEEENPILACYDEENILVGAFRVVVYIDNFEFVGWNQDQYSLDIDEPNYEFCIDYQTKLNTPDKFSLSWSSPDIVSTEIGGITVRNGDKFFSEGNLVTITVDPSLEEHGYAWRLCNANDDTIIAKSIGTIDRTFEIIMPAHDVVIYIDKFVEFTYADITERTKDYNTPATLLVDTWSEYYGTWFNLDPWLPIDTTISQDPNNPNILRASYYGQDFGIQISHQTANPEYKFNQWYNLPLQVSNTYPQDQCILFDYVKKENIHSLIYETGQSPDFIYDVGLYNPITHQSTSIDQSTQGVAPGDILEVSVNAYLDQLSHGFSVTSFNTLQENYHYTESMPSVYKYFLEMQDEDTIIAVYPYRPLICTADTVENATVEYQVNDGEWIAYPEEGLYLPFRSILYKDTSNPSLFILESNRYDGNRYTIRVNGGVWAETTLIITNAADNVLHFTQQP